MYLVAGDTHYILVILTWYLSQHRLQQKLMGVGLQVVPSSCACVSYHMIMIGINA